MFDNCPVLELRWRPGPACMILMAGTPGNPPGDLAAASGRTVAFELSDPRVLICGSRHWPWPGTVAAVLDRLAARYGERLVVIEGAARGADHAAHQWCERHGLSGDRHRCHP